MKLGTFVGKGSMTLGKDEREKFINKIKHILGVLFPNDKYEINEDTGYITFRVYLDYKTRRDRKGNTYMPKYIRMTFRKSYGYDEAVVGKFYEWEEGFVPEYNVTSFSCTTDLIGHYRRYRARNVETFVGITQTNYQYGTEFEDFDFYAPLGAIASYISCSTFESKALVK